MTSRSLLVAAIAALAALIPAAPAPAATLVALGDSYSSGEGAKAYDPGTDRRGNECHRSSFAWPRLLGASSTHLLACSGAQTAQLYAGMRNRDDRGQVPRLRELAARTTVDLVTITIGGNDIGFAGHVRNCFFSPLPCLADGEGIARDLDAVRADLARGYRAIRRAAPPARLVVVGYPEIVPSPGERDRCPTLSEGEKERAQRVAADLNRTIASAAGAADARFVSIRHVLDGHELCTPDSWLRPVGRFWVEEVQEMGHPSERGQRAIAAAVRARLVGLGLLAG